MIWDSGDVAHVVVTTTLPVLDSLRLERMLHTHAKNTFNTSKHPQPQIPAKKARASFPFKLIHTNTVREASSSKNSQNVHSSKILETQANRLSSQSLNRQARSQNQTNHVSCQLRATRGTACPTLYGSSELPLPPPNLVRRERFYHQIHAIQ